MHCVELVASDQAIGEVLDIGASDGITTLELINAVSKADKRRS